MKRICDHIICVLYQVLWFYFSFSRISSALMPLASSFFSTLSASAFLASSAALASAFAFFASKDATSFWTFFRTVFFSFSVFFCSSIAFWMDAISVFRDAIVSCFFKQHSFLSLIKRNVVKIYLLSL